MGVSTRKALSIDRLNDTESMELQPFTPGLNISKSQEETNSADSYGYVFVIFSREGTAATHHFEEASMSPCLDWDTLPSIRCNQKQNITFTYDFNRRRKLKSALLLPQEKGGLLHAPCAMRDGNSSVSVESESSLPCYSKEIPLLGHLAYVTGRPFLLRSLKLFMHTKACAQQ